MNSQLNLKNPNIILSFPPALTGLYPTINELPKSFLTTKMMELQAGAFQPRQPYILPCHQQMMQARINSLNTYMRTLRSLTPALERPNPIHQSHNQKDEKMIYEKSDSNEQDPKFFLKKEVSENQSTGSFSSTPISLRKEDASEKLKKKREKSASQISEFRKRKNYWLPHEDNMVLELMKTHGEKWTKIAACLGGRTGKQVRDRYLNYLKPSIKQKRWTPQEDELLEKLYKEHGNKWSTIASCLGDRTENQVKNRFYSGVRKGKYAHDKSVFSPDKITENPLKLVKMNSNFEKDMMPDLKSDVSGNLDKMPSVKEETFDMCDLLSQSKQTQMKGKDLNEEAPSVPCVKTFLMNQKFVFSNTEHHNNFLKNLISSKVCDSQQTNDEKIGDPYKKIKCENSENPQDIKVKQEVL